MRTLSSEFWWGLAIGLVVAAGVFLWQQHVSRTAPAHIEGVASTPAPLSQPPEPDVDPPSTSPWTFPDRLTTSEVVILPANRSAATATIPIAPIERPGDYILHLGMFATQAEAERLHTMLLELGIASEIQRLTIDDRVQYRIRIGVISQLAELNQTRATLHREGMSALVIRVGD